MNIKEIKPKYILIAILFYSLVLRLYQLDYPKSYVFDEVYHAFTAKEYAKGNKQAWEWWNSAPAGVAFEWTHPPLAKEIMALSMIFFKTDESWAWRLPGVLFGVLSVFLVYKLAFFLFKDETTSLISAFLFSIDGLVFVQSRTGMNDIYMITFMLASLLFLLKKKYFLSALIFGLALSSKWSSIYLLGAYGLIAIYFLFPFKIDLSLMKERTMVVLRVICYFILIPIFIYFLSYIPFFIQGHSLNQFKELQKQIWWYHTNLKASHDYASPFWSWPFNLYPVWYFVDYSNRKIANIFASGNPVLFWLGSSSIILIIWSFIKKRSTNVLIILLGFFVFWLPWAFSPRIMFLYHFSPSVPFLAMSLGVLLGKSYKEEKNRKFVLFILCACLLSFLAVYPFLTGISLSKDIVELFFYTNITKNPF